MLYAILLVLSIFATYKVFKWSHIAKADADHWEFIDGSDIGRNARFNYVVLFIIGLLFAFVSTIFLGLTIASFT
jgi:hypothetical protein